MKCLRCKKETDNENYYFCRECYDYTRKYSFKSYYCFACNKTTLNDISDGYCYKCIKKIKSQFRCPICKQEFNKYNAMKKDDKFICYECYNSNKEFPSCNEKDDDHKYKTDSGYYTRSKSEKFIADWFYKNNIKFLYEEEITIDKQILHPDFYLYENNMIVEHFGIDTQNYLKKTLDKIKLYMQSDYDFFFTTEEDIEDIEDILSNKFKEIEL